MSNIAAIGEIRRRLGLSLRESADAFNKYGSADAAVAALSTPEAMSAWLGPYEELARERRYSRAALAVALTFAGAVRTDLGPDALREHVNKCIDNMVKAMT